jgi:hypothetical protein
VSEIALAYFYFLAEIPPDQKILLLSFLKEFAKLEVEVEQSKYQQIYFVLMG